MKYLAALPPVLLAASLLLSGCAGTPSAEVPRATDIGPGTPDCRQIARMTLQAQAALREAQARQGEAWKAMVPFAVVARHAAAGSDAADEERRLAQLRTASRDGGCEPHAIGLRLPASAPGLRLAEGAGSPFDTTPDLNSFLKLGATQ